MRTTMSKAAMAKRLIELGCDKAFNTLRKYPLDHLEWMLEAHELPTMPTIELPPVEAPTEITRDMSDDQIAALETYWNAPIVESVPVASPAPYIPTDAEIMRPALTPAPVVEPAKERRTIGEWLQLAFSPFLLIRTVFGIA